MNTSYCQRSWPRVPLILVFAASLTLFSGVAAASTIYDTGVSDSGGLIGLGSADPNFLLFPSTCCYSGLTVNAFPSNFLTDGAFSGASPLADTATAEWIGYTGFGPYWANGGNATASFQETFTLSAADIAAGNLSVTGMLGFTGTYVGIEVNGVVDTADAFAADYGAALHPFDVTSGFQAGTNTLTFTESWTSAQGTSFGNSSTGVIVDDVTLSGGAAPEPGAWVLLATGVVLIAVNRRMARAAAVR